jgi:hypothetical protein
MKVVYLLAHLLLVSTLVACQHHNNHNVAYRRALLINIYVATWFVLRANRFLVDILHNNGWRHDTSIQSEEGTNKFKQEFSQPLIYLFIGLLIQSCSIRSGLRWSLFFLLTYKFLNIHIHLIGFGACYVTKLDFIVSRYLLNYFNVINSFDLYLQYWFNDIYLVCHSI